MIVRRFLLLHIGYLFLSLLLLLSTAGCETQVTAVTGTEKAFSFYGVLRPAADTQHVVVYPITEQLVPLTAESLDARVEMTDQATGTTYTLGDSAFQEPDGRWAHAFLHPRSVQYDRRYRIIAENSQGQETAVEVPVPPKTELQVMGADTLGGVRIPILVKGNAPRLMHLETEYRVKYRPGSVERSVDTLFIDYDEQQEQVEGGWKVTINLSSDYEKLHDWCADRCWGNYARPWGLKLISMRIHLTVVNEAWDPPGSEYEKGVRGAPGPGPSFDPEVLVQPGTMSNVENGFGFVGAGYRLKTEWRPRRRALELAGFRPL